jgi:hypothetical protein
VLALVLVAPRVYGTRRSGAWQVRRPGRLRRHRTHLAEEWAMIAAPCRVILDAARVAPLVREAVTVPCSIAAAVVVTWLPPRRSNAHDASIPSQAYDRLHSTRWVPGTPVRRKIFAPQRAPLAYSDSLVGIAVPSRCDGSAARPLHPRRRASPRWPRRAHSSGAAAGHAVWRRYRSGAWCRARRPPTWHARSVWRAACRSLPPPPGCSRSSGAPPPHNRPPLAAALVWQATIALHPVAYAPLSSV